MPNLMLGFAAKEVAKARFRAFHITLPGIPAASQATLRSMIQQTPQLAQSSTSNVHTVALVGSSSSGSSAASNPPPTATPMQFPPALFRSASNSADDVQEQRGMHDMFSALFDGVIDAMEHGFNQYRQSAGLVGVQIRSIIATGGRLEGPALDGLIARAPSVAGWGGWNAMVRDAVAKGMERQWKEVADSVRVPSLPWYPGFFYSPTSGLPPSANVPTPFAALSQDLVATSTYKLKSAMRSQLHGNMDYSMEFFESVATALQTPLQAWKQAQLVAGVIGRCSSADAGMTGFGSASVGMLGKTDPGSHINR